MTFRHGVVRFMRRWSVPLVIACLSTVVVVPAQADVVDDWNTIAITTVIADKQPPNAQARTVAMVHAAMFDAVNAIHSGYAPYATKLRAAAGASDEAAAATAAHAVLAHICPDARATLDKAHAESLARVAAGDSRDKGIALGGAVAKEILAARANDGIGAPNGYQPLTTPGVWVGTMLPVGVDMARLKPFLMEQSSQFRPGAPPTLTSEAWVRDYNEIRALGGRSSTARTALQTDVGRFWAVVGPPSWNPPARQFAIAKKLSLVDKTRVLALVHMAAADAYVAVFDAKFAYNFWRPITAIRNGGGNSATVTDPMWVPLIDTPMHPEYPCAHCITSAAVGAVLTSLFGDGPVTPITMTSTATPGVVRRFERISEYVDEVSNARIWAGVHYRTSAQVGRQMGTSIGELAVRNFLKPLP